MLIFFPSFKQHAGYLILNNGLSKMGSMIYQFMLKVNNWIHLKLYFKLLYSLLRITFFFMKKQLIIWFSINIFCEKIMVEKLRNMMLEDKWKAKILQSCLKIFAMKIGDTLN